MSIADRLKKNLSNAPKSDTDSSPYVQFAQTYRAMKKRESGGIWNVGETGTGSISYMEDGKAVQSPVHWLEASVLAKKMSEVEIFDIITSPVDKAKIAVQISRSLDYVVNPREQSDYDTRNYHAKEAIAGMYLLGLTGNKTLLRKIERGLKTAADSENAEKLRKESKKVMTTDDTNALGHAMWVYGIVDEYHRDLGFSPDVLLSVIASKLRPEKGTDEQIFDRSLREHYDPNHTGFWGDGVNAAKAYFTEDGVQKSERLGWTNTAKFAERMKKGEVKGVKISPRDRGKIYASILRSRDRLATDPVATTDYYVSRLYPAEMIAGLYVLEMLESDKTLNMFTELLKKVPGLTSTFERELAKYSPEA